MFPYIREVVYLVIICLCGCSSEINVDVNKAKEQGQTPVNVVFNPSFNDGLAGSNIEIIAGEMKIRTWTDSERQIASSDAVFGPSLEALWHLEANTTSSVDSSGNNRDLTPVGTVADATGKLGNALSLSNSGNLSVNSMMGNNK